MANPRPTIGHIIAKKLKSMMLSNGMKQRALAAESGVSQRQISNVLNCENSPSVDIVDALAKPFGLSGWHLQAPQIPAGYEHVGRLEKLIFTYTHASDELRAYLDSIVEREGTPQNRPHEQKLDAA